MESIDDGNKSFNTKIIVTAIVSVLLGAAFVLALILFGMNVQRNFDNKTAEKQQKEKIVSVINVDYGEPVYFSYNTGKIREADSNPVHNLLDKLSVSKSKDYFVIDSNDKLNAVLDAAGHTGEYTVEDDYFSSSSIVAVPFEHDGLESLKIKGISRDEDYNITVSGVYNNPLQIINITGIVALIKLQNIQPKLVTVSIEPDLPTL